LSESYSSKSKSFILSILILQIIVFFVIYADIPIARMVVCFFYLLFVPGIVILNLLELKSLDVSEKLLFSVGLSIAFLMLIGVIINELGKLVFTNPLSVDLLILSINGILLLSAFIGNRRTGSSSAHMPQLKSSGYLFPILVCILLLLLGSYGIIIMNYSGNNLFLLLLIVVICIVVPLVFLSEKLIPKNFHPFLLLIIFVCALLFVSTHYALITPYITGAGDQWLEYKAFKSTGQFWDSTSLNAPPLFQQYFSMVSVTILPTVFSAITAMDSSMLFKLLYPLVASFVAIGTYKLYRTQTDRKTAFLATFFLITVSVGKGMGPARQQIAQLFYVLLFLLIFKKGMSNLKRNVLLIIFGTGLVMSHYSLTYIFLLLIFTAFLIFVFIDFIKTGRIRISQAKIQLTFILLFATITFSWYIYVNGSAAFNPLIQTVTRVINSLDQFFNPASRGTALEGLGFVPITSIYYEISRVVFILTEFLVVLGFYKLVINRNQSSGFSTEYKIFATLNLAIIAVNILLPSIADTFLMERFYQTTLLILAPLAVIGGKALLDIVLRHHFQKLYVFILVCLVFVPLFLFQTNFVYEVTQDKSYNLTLSKYRWNTTELHATTVSTQEVIAAQWIPQHTILAHLVVKSDYTSLSNVLTAYGGIFWGEHIYSLINQTTVSSSSLIYIPNIDSIYDEGAVLNASLVLPIVDNQNKIYSNGKCEIYKGCTPP